jgi:signal transduction histidine kinase
MLKATKAKIIGLDLNKLKDKSILPILRDALKGKDEKYEGFYHATSGPAELWISLFAGPLFNEKGEIKGAVGVMNDISESKKREKNIEWMNEVVHSLLQKRDLQSTYDIIQENSTKITDSEFGFLDILTPQGDLRRVSMSHSVHSKCRISSYNEKKGIVIKKDRLDKLLMGRIIATGKSQVVNDPSKFWSEKKMPKGHPKISSFLGVPISYKQRVIGVIGVANKKEEYTSEDQGILETFGGSIGVILERIKSEEMTKNYAFNLESEVNTRTKLLMDAKKKVEDLSIVKDEFIRNITHELKTPLSVILGNLALLKDMAPIGREKGWSKLLEMLNRNSMRLNGSINQILQLSRLRKTEIKRERVYLKEIIGTAYQDHLPLAKMKDLELKQKTETIVLIGDNELIKLAINNLVSNAIKFTNKGSVEIIAKVMNNYISISVIDTGIGISPENQKRIFEKFFKADPSAPGTGIGLNLVEAIVNKHGGKITVKSKPGKGSVFEIVLPRGTELANRKGKSEKEEGMEKLLLKK